MSLREQTLQKTHAPVFEIYFFQQRVPEFVSRIVQNLKPLSFSKGEIVYENGDTTDSIYFISRGTVILYIDILFYVEDSNLRMRVQMFEQKNYVDDPNVDNQNKSTKQILKPSLEPLIEYSKGNYFGDADLYSYYDNKIESKTRLQTAVANRASIVFQLKEQDILLIEDRFPDVYEELQNRALRRHKNHVKLTRDMIKKHKENLEFEDMEEISSAHSFSSRDPDSSQAPLTELFSGSPIKYALTNADTTPKKDSQMLSPSVG